VAEAQRAWAEYDESKALLLWVAHDAMARPTALRRSYFEVFPAKFEVMAADVKGDVLRWANADANGFEEDGAAGW
jgi:hypothetical protein